MIFPALCERVPARAIGAFVFLLGISFSGGCAGRATDLSQTNLLLITIDTLRADRLGAYGYQPIETPAMDALAAEGTRFDHAVAPTPSTLPSHSSIFTGMTPLRHGVRDNSVGVVAQSATTMAEAFRAAGYRTGAFVGAYVLDRRMGLSQGFDTYGSPPLAPGTSPSALSEAERRGDAVLDEALPWIREQGGERWFAWVHLFDPHSPYWPPAPFDRQYAGREYDGEVAWVDSLIAEIRASLEENGQWDDTTVLLTSDHGESLGEHGEPTHAYFIYDATLRVPFILRPADRVGDLFPRGRVVETAVGLVDIFPTVAELHALELPEPVEGRSLVAALRGEGIPQLAIYSESLLPRLYYGWSELRAITKVPYKLIDAPTPELYNLADDPGEQVNLATDHPDEVDDLRTELTAWLEGGEVANTTAMSPERLAALRALGYLAASTPTNNSDNLADPKDKIETYRNLGLVLGAWRGGNLERALALIDAEIERDPAFPGARHMRGTVLASSGRLEDAAAAFRETLEVAPNHTVATRDLARTLRRLGRLDEAADLFLLLLDADPRDAALRWELGGVYLDDERLPEAERLFQEGLSLDAQAARLHFGLGLLELRRGDPSAALGFLDRAVELGSELEELHYQRGVVLEALDRREEALAAYTAETLNQPLHYHAHIGRARLLAELGPGDELIPTLRAALRARPEAPEAMLFLAQALAESGGPTELEEAEGLAERGLRAVDTPQLRAMGHLTLAQIYAAQGRDEEAQQQRAAAEELARRG